MPTLLISIALVFSAKIVVLLTFWFTHLSIEPALKMIALIYSGPAFALNQCSISASGTERTLCPRLIAIDQRAEC